MIGKKSRYARTGTFAAVDAAGETTEALELRAAPAVSAVFAHTPVQGERLDHLAQRYYRDPRKFWKLCDAADELDPFEVVAPGRPLPVPPDK